MSLGQLLRPSYWDLFSKKLKAKIEHPQYAGYFTAEEAAEKNMRLVIGKEGKESCVCFYWLVDESDGIICDVKFQVLGPSGLIGAAEVASELVLRKNYDQISRISADLLDQHVRDQKHLPAFPEECNLFLNAVIAAIDQAVYQCSDIPFEASYEITPISYDASSHEGIPDWEKLPSSEKIRVIEEVIDKEIRPYIELDAGGIKVLGLKEWEVLISYEGSCTSCHSATGSTLTAIQQILRARIHPQLFVTPDL